MTDIDRDLAHLSTHLSWPETPDIAGHVRRSVIPSTVRKRRVVAVTALAVAAAFVVVLLAVPAARDRVTAFFGIGAVTIEQGSLTAPPAAELPGTEVDPAEVNVALPAALGAPDGVFRDTAGRLWIAYRPGGGRPDALLTVFDTAVEAGLTKLAADPSIQAEQVQVDGTAAYWVSGDDHFILFEDTGGEVVEDRGRRSAPALIWVRGGITYRLEIDVDRSTAIEIAESTP